MTPPSGSPRFITGSVGKHVLSMILTNWVSMLSLFTVELLALLYLGTLQDDAVIGAVGFASMTQFLIVSACLGVSVGGTALVSRALGASEPKRAFELASAATWMMLTVALGMAVLFLLVIGPVMRMLGIEGRMLALALRYVWITTPFVVCGGVGMVLASILRSAGHAQLAMWMLLAGTFTAAVLDAVLIWGLGWGIDGAAIASASARLVTLLAAMYYVMRVHRLASWRVPPGLLQYMRELGRIALPASLTALATPVAVIFTVGAFAAYGESVMAGATVIDRVLQFSFALFFTLPSALGPVIGQNLGAGRWDRVKLTISTSLRGVTLYGFAVATVLAVLAPWVPQWFQITGRGAELIVFFCRYGSFAWALNSLYFVAISAFNNLGHATWSTAFSWLRTTLGTIPFVLLGSHLGGPEGVIVGQGIGNVIFAVLAIVVCYRVLAKPPRVPAHGTKR